GSPKGVPLKGKNTKGDERRGQQSFRPHSVVSSLSLVVAKREVAQRELVDHDVCT
ncbi:hypothetical protein VOLCADRAFT_71890, partial [Volvox carteri f. nagariensis]